MRSTTWGPCGPTDQATQLLARLFHLDQLRQERRGQPARPSPSAARAAWPVLRSHRRRPERVGTSITAIAGSCSNGIPAVAVDRPWPPVKSRLTQLSCAAGRCSFAWAGSRRPCFPPPRPLREPPPGTPAPPVGWCAPGGKAGQLVPLATVLDDVQPGALLSAALRNAARSPVVTGSSANGQPVGVPRGTAASSCRSWASAAGPSAVADDARRSGRVPVGVQGDERSDAAPVQRQAQVEQRGAARQPLLAAARVGGGKAALRIGPQLDHLRSHRNRHGWQLCSDGARPAVAKRSATSSELRPRAAGRFIAPQMPRVAPTSLRPKVPLQARGRPA